MFEQFSEPARRAVFWARREAAHLGSETIEPEHLLLGLLLEDQSPREPAFFSAEVAERLRRMVSASITPGPPKPDGVDMLVADGSKRALVTAKERAGESTVGLLHVLLALMSDPDSLAASVLKSEGVTAGQIEGAIRGRGDSRLPV